MDESSFLVWAGIVQTMQIMLLITEFWWLLHIRSEIPMKMMYLLFKIHNFFAIYIISIWNGCNTVFLRKRGRWREVRSSQLAFRPSNASMAFFIIIFYFYPWYVSGREWHDTFIFKKKEEANVIRASHHLIMCFYFLYFNPQHMAVCEWLGPFKFF